MKKQLQTALDYLSQQDVVLAEIIAKVGPCAIMPRKNYYKALVNSIIAQQISVSASRSIRNKFMDLINQNLEPENVVLYSIVQLRSVGLSIQKASYIYDLSLKFAQNKNVYNHLGRFSDEEVIKMLTEVKGIGVWTAQMFLIFSLGRLDILPLDDVGFRNAVQIQYNMKSNPSKNRLERLAAKWKPYRSVAVWYLWQAVDKQP